jgi:hypothetical protein
VGLAFFQSVGRLILKTSSWSRQTSGKLGAARILANPATLRFSWTRALTAILHQERFVPEIS